MILRAIGAAAELPWPPFSTITATATCGWYAGANEMNSAWSRKRSGVPCSLYFAPWAMPLTCAVPVLPDLVGRVVADAVGGAARAVRDLGQIFDHGIEMCFVLERQLGIKHRRDLPRLLRRRVNHGTHHRRACTHAAVGKRRHRRNQLQRRGQDRSLADSDDHGFTR